MKILFLDDNGMRRDLFAEVLVKKNQGFTYCETAKEACNKLRKERFDVIFLDHDLGGEWFAPSDENSGYAVAKFISELPIAQGQVIVHSYNNAGAQNMLAVLPAGTPWIPFGGHEFWRAVDELFKQKG